MPIPREQFDTGLGPLEQAIVQLLRHNPGQAFSLHEIVKTVGIDSDDVLARFSFASALDNLIRRGLIESKFLGGTIYYAVSRSSSKR